MARRAVAVVLGVILTVVLCLHLLTRHTVVPFGGDPEISERLGESQDGPFLNERDQNGGGSPSERNNEPPDSKVGLARREEPEEIASMVESLLRKADESGPRAAFEQVVALSTFLPKITNISRFKTPSAETFRNYIAPAGLPVIFTDMFDGSLLRQWTWDYVKGKWGEQVFHNTRQGNYSTKKATSGKYFVNRVSVTLGDFIDVVTGKRAPRKHEKGLYITKQKIIPTGALEAEFFYPPFYPGPHTYCYLEPTAWIGAPGTFTQGHIDSKDNFAYQIIGKKRWTIFSPTDYKYLYYIHRTGSLEWSTALNSLTEPDLEKFPLYAKATPISFTLFPGEVLYLPRGWTHTVRNLSPSLMINTWRYGPAAITEHWSDKNRVEIRKRCY